ncbi:MAG TPA: bacteriohemerythrin [Dehalococcoidales bacterium]|nr:bacteriohemerythrin [Dehalococcoidales bacterium]
MTSSRIRSITGINSSMVKWDSGYSVSIAEIDQQHKRLIASLNDLTRTLSQNKNGEVLEEALDCLLTCTREHFTTEENLFAQYAYPWATTHITEHHVFLQKINEFAHDFKQGKVALNGRFPEFVANWMKTHIVGKDKTYTYFFIMKGLR